MATLITPPLTPPLYLDFILMSIFDLGERGGEHETVRHSLECNAGTAPFLAVNSATIIVIRGIRACVWGSIYLDSFGEEDKELK
jgi:hypothetical protein